MTKPSQKDFIISLYNGGWNPGQIVRMTLCDLKYVQSVVRRTDKYIKEKGNEPSN